MKRAERGSGLIVIIVVIAFLLTVGVMVVTVTSTGPKVSGNVRSQEEAFNAAEAGFDASRIQMENLFSNGTWTSFDGHYLVQPAGIDMPTLSGAFNPLYFRSLSDEELLGLIDPDGNGLPDLPNTIFFQQPFTTTSVGADDLRYTYTTFLINDEAGAGVLRSERRPPGDDRSREGRDAGPGDIEIGDRFRGRGNESIAAVLGTPKRKREGGTEHEKGKMDHSIGGPAGYSGLGGLLFKGPAGLPPGFQTVPGGPLWDTTAAIPAVTRIIPNTAIFPPCRV